MKPGFVRAALVAGGIFYLITGIALLAAPQWFFDNVGTYPPFNRHYAGDLGSFLLPLGIALVWAARNPVQHRGLIAFAAAGSGIHAANHLYDDLMLQSPELDITTPLILLVFTLVLVGAYVAARPERA
jgi:hypothetical protein